MPASFLLFLHIILQNAAFLLSIHMVMKVLVLGTEVSEVLDELRFFIDIKVIFCEIEFFSETTQPILFVFRLRFFRPALNPWPKFGKKHPFFFSFCVELLGSTLPNFN
jgi:hypothetical protein